MATTRTAASWAAWTSLSVTPVGPTGSRTPCATWRRSSSASPRSRCSSASRPCAPASAPAPASSRPPSCYGGSGQLTAITLMGGGAGAGAVLAAVTLVNARFLLYAAALEPHFRDQPRWFRWAAAHFVVDPTYAMVTRRPDLDDPARFRRYWLTAGGVLAVAWVAMTALGGRARAGAAGVVGARRRGPRDVPRDARAAAARPPGRGRRAAAAVTAVVASPLPTGLGLLCGIAAGVVAQRHPSPPGPGARHDRPARLGRRDLRAAHRARHPRARPTGCPPRCAAGWPTWRRPRSPRSWSPPSSATGVRRALFVPGPMHLALGLVAAASSRGGPATPPCPSWPRSR